MRIRISAFSAVVLVGSVLASAVSAAPAPCSGGVVALTYDDGPTPETHALLDELKAYGLRATFFLIGWNVEAYPDIAQRIVREGHAVANHSWIHRDLATMTAEEVYADLKATNDIIRSVTGVRPRFVRPPYGSTNDVVQTEMTRLGLTEVIWSQDSWDWTGTTSQEILNMLTLVPPGGTYLMHDRMPNTQAAVSAISWYFNTYWAETPICAGRLAATTNVHPVLDWFGVFYRAYAVRWPR